MSNVAGLDALCKAMTAQVGPQIIDEQLQPQKMPRDQEAARAAKIRSLDLLLDATLGELQRVDLKQIDVAVADTLLKVVSSCGDYFKRIMPLGIAPEDERDLKAKISAAKCGGRVSYEIFKNKALADFKKFLEANFIPNKLMTLRMQLRADPRDGHPLLPIANMNRDSEGRLFQPPGEDATRYVRWDALEKQEVRDNAGKLTGYRFRHDGVTVFETNDKLEMNIGYQDVERGYSFNHRGILPYCVKATQALPYDQRNPAEWGNKYIVEVWTALADKKGEKIQLALGDHTFLKIRNGKTGEIYGAGEFGIKRDYKPLDYLTPLGHKTSGLETPDRYTFLPQSMFHFRMVEMEVTKAEFEKLITRIEAEKADRTRTFSLVKQNCTSWSVKIVREELGVDLDAKMSILGFAIRQLCPISWQKPLFQAWDNSVGRLPEWAQKAMYLLHVILIVPYVLHVVISLIVKGLAMKNDKHEADFPLLDIFFRPWNIYLDHPYALRQSSKKAAKMGEKLYEGSQAMGVIQRDLSKVEKVEKKEELKQAGTLPDAV
jgi:hypothetical protein